MRKKFRTYLLQGHFIRFGKKREKTSFKHYFCGKHNIKNAICPNCKKPLLRFVKFDLGDNRLQLQNNSLEELSLFYCWTCPLSQESFFYKCLKKGEIEVLEYKQGAGWDDFPYKSYPAYFPGSCAELVELSPLEQEILKELNAGKMSKWIMQQLKPELCQPTHQVGGEPYLVQNDLRLMVCPECLKPMPFFAAIGDHAIKNKSFSGNSFIQVVYYFCGKCQIIGAGQEID